MDDGSKQNNGIHLNVYAFNEKSIEFLLYTLRTKFSLVCSIHYHTSKGKNRPRIYISQNSMPILRTIIQKHMVPSMYYKIGV